MSNGIYGKIPLQSLMLQDPAMLLTHKQKFFDTIDVFSRQL